MTENRSNIESSLIKLLMADIGYGSGGSNKFMLNLDDGMGEYFGSTKHFMVYRKPDSGRYNIYRKGVKTHPVSVNLDSMESAADWLIDAESSDLPFQGFEEETITLETPMTVEDRWQSFQKEKKTKRQHPLREIGYIEEPPNKAQYVGGTLFRGEVPFEEQTAIWKKSPRSEEYEITPVYEHKPTWEHKTKIARKLSERELREAIQHPEQYGVSHPWGYQPEISFRNPETGEYEFTRYTPRGGEKEELLPRKFTQPKGGWGVMPSEESTLAKWSLPESPEGIMKYEQRKREMLERNVPTGE